MLIFLLTFNISANAADLSWADQPLTEAQVIAKMGAPEKRVLSPDKSPMLFFKDIVAIFSNDEGKLIMVSDRAQMEAMTKAWK